MSKIWSKIMSKKKAIGAIAGGIILVPTLALANSNQTAFYVSTNGRTGRVNYDIHLNSDCSPVSNNPVYTYYKKADGSTRPLSSQEAEGYQISQQSVSGNTINLVLSAFQHYGIERPITITTTRSTTGNCHIQTLTTISGAPTPLAYAHVEVNRRQLLGQTVGVQLLTLSLVGLNQQHETFICQSNCTYGF